MKSSLPQRVRHVLTTHICTPQQYDQALDNSDGNYLEILARLYTARPDLFTQHFPDLIDRSNYYFPAHLSQFQAANLFLDDSQSYPYNNTQPEPDNTIPELDRTYILTGRR